MLHIFYLHKFAENFLAIIFSHTRKIDFCGVQEVNGRKINDNSHKEYNYYCYSKP